MRDSAHRFLLLVVNVLIGVNAIVAGAMFVADPTGGLIGMPSDVLRTSPFSSFLVPGLVLGLVVGGSSLRAAWQTWKHAGALPSLVAGGLLIGWILVQMGMIREINGLQLFCLGCGLAQLGLGWTWPASTTRAALARRFLAYDRIAIVGLSRNPEDFSHAVRKELEASGRKIVGVGRDQRVSELTDPPRAVILMVPPEAAHGVVEDCIVAGVEAIWFHRGAGQGSASPGAVARATSAGLLVVTDACPLMYVGEGLHGAHRWVREHAQA